MANYHHKHFARAASLWERSVQLLGDLERFREQGGVMCRIGGCRMYLDDAAGATSWFEKARQLGQTRGFPGAECEALLGLGRVEFEEGREREGEERLRHALTVLERVEDGDGRENLERLIRDVLANFLLETDRYEEAEPLIRRLRELAAVSTDPTHRATAEVRRRPGPQNCPK